MHINQVTTMNTKRLYLKESQGENMGGFGVRKANREMQLNYDLNKNKESYKRSVCSLKMNLFQF